MIKANSPSLLALANTLRSGELSFDDYLGQLEARFNKWEPDVQAFLPEAGRFDRLRRQALALLERYPHPINRPPLFGLPLGVKDIFHVDGFRTRAGSRIPVEELEGRQAQSVSILKETGVLIAGKTVTTEFAYFAAGPTRNPHDLEHTPGGSSSGSAAAVAAGLCPIALGTQTIGSVIRPASFCGVVGYKPSYDRISRYGVIPLSPSLDHVGVFANDVAGVELVASQLCPDWQIVVRESKPVLGIPEGPYLEKASEEGLDHFNSVCEKLKTNGCEILAVPAMANFAEIQARHQLIVAAEAAQVHAQWYSAFRDEYHPKTAELIERGREIAVGKLAEATIGRRELRMTLTDLMDEHGLDLWISPSARGAAPRGLTSTGDPVMNLPWTHSGLPAVSLPAGRNNMGLPLGLQVVGRWYEDEAVLEWCAQLELMVE